MSSHQGFFESENQYVRRVAGDAAGQAANAAARADERISRNVSQVDRRIVELAERVSSLSRAFDSFVELSEVRDELARFVPAAAARMALQPFVQGLTPGEDRIPVPAELADVPGYWLPQAARGLASLLRDEPSAEAHLAAATARDARRTALFLAFALGLVGAGDRAEPWLGTALGPTPASGEITLGTRRLWCELAEGNHGAGGRAALAGWLARPGAVGSTAGLRAAVEARLGRVRPSYGAVPGPVFGPRVPASAEIEHALETAASAAAALGLLQRWYSVEWAGPAQEEAAALLGSAQLLRALVDEGSPEEIPLLRRAARLKRVVRPESTDVPQYWDAPAGDAGELVIADLLNTDPEQAGLRRTALAALRHSAAEVAEQLLSAASVPAPEQLTFTLEGETLTVTHGGRPTEAVARLSAVVDRRLAEDSAQVKRKFVAEMQRRAEERKAELTVLLSSAGERLDDYRARSEAIGQAAVSAHRTLMYRLGQVEEEAVGTGSG